MRALAVRSPLPVGCTVFFIADIPKFHIDQVYSLLYIWSIREDGMNEPLKGVCIISIATNLPGPLAAARLAAFGADVIKVEPPVGDALAAAEPDWYRELIIRQRVKV